MLVTILTLISQLTEKVIAHSLQDTDIGSYGTL